MYCNGIGSLKFVSCNNVTIEGVNWDRCGSVNNPGMEFDSTSNIVIQHCSFHHSSGRIFTLSGNVSINNCLFTHNKYHRGHGAAIYYTSSYEQSTHLVISNCDFTLNGPAESVVYIDRSVNGLLQNSIFTRNQGVPIYISHTTLILNNTISFKDNKATDSRAIYSISSTVKFNDRSNVVFCNNSALYYGGAIYQIYSKMFFMGNAVVMFTSNVAVLRGGGAICQLSYSSLYFLNNTEVKFTSNLAKRLLKNDEIQESGSAVSSMYHSLISFEGQSMVRFNGNSAYNGGAIIAYHYSNTIFRGNSTMSFDNNITHRGNELKTGGAICAIHNSAVSFGQKSTVYFSGNDASRFGGAVYVQESSIEFHGNSAVKFSKNHGGYGGAIASLLSHGIRFTDNSTITFSGNTATGGGGALLVTVIVSELSDIVTFTGNSKVIFSNNSANQGGALVFRTFNDPFKMNFQGNTNVTFVNNRATLGGAMYCSTTCHILFTGSAAVNFTNNKASLSGGAISVPKNSIIWFTGGSGICFDNNLARQHGGAILSVINTRITFNEICSVMFTSNRAIQQGGAVYLFDKSTITFGDSCNVSYDNNSALQQGGAVYFTLQSTATFKGDSAIEFVNNTALLSGGALYSFINRPIHFEENSKISFIYNTVGQDGGAIQSVNTTLYFSASVSVIRTFTNNTAMQQGGALNLFHNSAVIFQKESNITFTHNRAMQYGGAVYVHNNSSVSFVGNAKVVFYHNMAKSDGGALYSYDHCNITIGQYSEVAFVSNSAMQCGGAMYCDRHSDVTLQGPVTFTSNAAEDGGAVCMSQSIMKFANNSVVMLDNNRAIENGGGLYFTDKFAVTFVHGSSIKFACNAANRYGGALYSEVSREGLSKLQLYTTEISFFDNRALSGNSAYLNIPTSCDKVCLNKSIVGVNRETLKHGPFAGHIHTPPSKLVLYDPAVCIDDDNVSSCGTYYVTNIMLGQEIITGACVLDYYDQTADEFMLDSNNEDHYINGTNSVLISCTELQSISITGSKIGNAKNFTMNLTSHVGSRLGMKTISIKLITELSPCHLAGFYYGNKSCVCYDDNDIITCSGSTSFIRRGYWFGVVSDKSTKTVCPNNYCNFTCCEVTNGFYLLSPLRINQCSLHRSGTACGSCEEGYTLAFDSVDCVSVDKCTTGQMVLVVTLSMIYWIVIVILVFIMTCYHVGIGYLYAITYYYSLRDILLSQSLYQSKQLFTAISSMSSIVKITPQFLGQFCLVENMSGIDQQFIHYTHPLAVSVIIAIICQAARISHKFSSFISRGIICTVCFLLLLSYTSVATTSLLLLRSLKFDNVDKVYTYVPVT